jgi:hypothetical protein
MTIGDERQLRAQLGIALDEFSPGPLPLDAVVRQGRAVRFRRRVTAIAGVVIVAAATATAPALARQFGHQAPTAPAHYRVTVSPPGRKSPPGLIARGTIGERTWEVTGSNIGSARDPSFCFRAPEMTCEQGSPPAASHRGDPATFSITIGARPVVVIGTVRADITSLQFSLGNGKTLTVRPRPVFGPSHASYVAVEVPFSAAITEIRAYAGARELAYAVPFTAARSFATERWLKPGQPAAPKPAKYLIGSGTADGTPWSYYAYTGPWGTCLRGGGYGSVCQSAGLGQLGGGKAVDLLLLSSSSQKVYEGLLTVSGRVGYLVLRLPHGTAVAVFGHSARTFARLVSEVRKPVSLLVIHVAAGVRFVSFDSGPGNLATGWVAYTANGRELASGRIPR